MKKLKWVDDSDLYEISENNTGLTHYLDDGYAQWTLGPGRDFEVTETIRQPAKPADYRFFSIVRNLSERLEIGIALGTAEPTSNSSRTPTNDHLIARLPIRTRSEIAGHEVIALEPYVPPHGLAPKQTIVFGIIDDSFNPVHERFLVEDDGGHQSTRFDYLWAQDGISSDANLASVNHGREYTRQDINAVLNQNPNLDETTMLKRLGLIDMRSQEFQPNPLQLNVTHGNFVSNIAAGYSKFDDTAINRRIVAAQLPIMATQDTSGSTLISSIICSIQYIFERAKAMSEATGIALPVVINFSYGLFGGPHNGKHIVEQAFIENSEVYRADVKNLIGGDDVPVEIVLPAGNNALGQAHAVTKKATRNNQKLNLDLNLRVQPQDQTSSYVEFWLPKNASKTKIEVVLPDGNKENFKLDDLNNPFGQVLAKKLGSKVTQKTIVARLKLNNPIRDADNDPSGNYWRVLLAIAPTLVLDEDRMPAPAGIWEIKVSAKIPKNACLESWIQRDVAVSGASIEARQAYFEDAVYEDHRFDALTDISVYDRCDTQIKRNGTISGVATFKSTDDEKIGVTIVGGYQWSNNAGSFYSAAGSDITRNVETMVTTDTSRALAGILSIGTNSGSTKSLSGTSVGSPQAARLLTDAIAEFLPEDRDQFSRSAALSAYGTGPVARPTTDNPERLTNDVIRIERNEASRLSPVMALKDNVERGRHTSA